MPGVYVFRCPLQGLMFTIEMLLLDVAAVRRVEDRWSGRRRWAFAAAIPVVTGVILNRLNVAWIGLLPAPAPLLPSWMRSVVLNLVSFGVVIFARGALLALFEHPDIGGHHAPGATADMTAIGPLESKRACLGAASPRKSWSPSA